LDNEILTLYVSNVLWLALLNTITTTTRNKASEETLQQMLPPDMLRYCQEHGLLDEIWDVDNRKPAARPTAVAVNTSQYDAM
jgi:hypothetical protein